MGKSVADAVLDGAWAVVSTNVDLMSVCETEPTTASQARNTKGTADGKSLAQVAMAPGDFAVADGDVSGRKQTVAAKSGLTIDANGTADHVALSSAALLYYVTTAPSQGLSTGGTVDVGSWKMEILDPA